jgi:hypothetical protein
MAFLEIFILSTVISVLNIDFISLGGFFTREELVEMLKFQGRPKN